MPAITLDNDLRAKLNGLNEVMPVQDESGRTIGRFVPEEEFRKMIYVAAKASCPFSEEEMERRRKEKGGSTLQEFWQRNRQPIEIPYSEEELQRRDQEVGTHTLQDIWKELGVNR